MQYADVAIAMREGGKDQFYTYSIPPELLAGIQVGVVVEVPFRAKTHEGVVVGLRRQTAFADRLRPIKRLLSPWPVLTEFDLTLRKKIAQNLLQSEPLTCTLGLPPRSMYNEKEPLVVRPHEKPPITPPTFWLGDTSAAANRAIVEIKKTLVTGQTVCILAPTKELQTIWLNACQKAKIAAHHYESTSPADIQRDVWRTILEGTAAVVIGGRATSLLPFRKLGLTIIDQPSHHQFLEEQAPYYQAFDVLKLRSALDGSPIIAIDALPPLALLVGQERSHWKFIELRQEKPSTTVSYHPAKDTLRPTVISQLIERDTAQSILIIVPEAGWAHGLICRDCGELVRCLECDNRLAASTKQSELTCSRCATTQPLPESCMHCGSTNLGHIGWGIERWIELITQELGNRHNVHIVRPSWYRLPPESADVVIVIEPERLLYGARFDVGEDWLRLLLEARARAKQELICITTIKDATSFPDLTQTIPANAVNDELRSRQTFFNPPFGHVMTLVYPTEPKTAKNLASAEALLREQLPEAKSFRRTTKSDEELIIKTVASTTRVALRRYLEMISGKPRVHLRAAL